MANPYINRVDVQRGNTVDTLINISDTTATEADVADGKWFYKASGEKARGTATGGIDGDNLGYGVSTQPLVGTARVGATEI